MKKIFEFKCPVHGIFDAMAWDNTEKKPCPACQRECGTKISAPNFHLPGYDPAFPTAWDRWAKDHEQRAKKAKQESDS
jgi:hypothetical protein